MDSQFSVLTWHTAEGFPLAQLVFRSLTSEMPLAGSRISLPAPFLVLLTSAVGEF